ncbi:MAG TPA: hypothetical protein VK588_11170 [Chitinophagaceae bacterium]|nr:hypothetical protein [Chitinophagaceae bacterium]
MKKSNLIFKGIVVILAASLFVSCKKELDQPKGVPQITPKESLQKYKLIITPYDTTREKPAI